MRLEVPRILVVSIVFLLVEAVLSTHLVLLIVRFAEKVAIAVRIGFGHPLLLFPGKLSFIIFLVVDHLEDGKALLWGDAALTLQDVDHDAVGALLDSLECEAGLFSQSSLITQLTFVSEVVDTVKELASLTVHAVAFILVLATELGLVVGGEVCLGHQLLHVVSVAAAITIFTVLVHNDVSAHFSLLHLFDFLVEFESLLLIVEPLLLGAGGLSCVA